jgi:hypothetical protein
MSSAAAVPYEDVHALTLAVLRTGLMLSDLLGNLLDALPSDAFPGEDDGEVLVEMLSGTIMPVADATGREKVRDATALLAAVSDKVLADLERTAELARQGQPRPRDCGRRARAQRSSLS